MQELDTPEIFWDGDAANTGQINAILAYYKSPLFGRGDLIARLAREEHVNPLLLLSIMQEETEFGRGEGGNGKPEWAANPFAIHLTESAKGIARLRSADGKLSTFEHSLRAAIEMLKQAARNASTPLTSAARLFQPTNPTLWALSVANHFRRLKRHV